MSDYLPPELLIQILTRLPIKSLLRSRCVCKSWNSLIFSPTFVTGHLNTTNDHALILLGYYDRNRNDGTYICSLRFDDESLTEYLKLDYPYEGKRKVVSYVGFNNGVVCLAKINYGCTDKLIFWNPSIRKILKIPRPGIVPRIRGYAYRVIVAFGFDSLSNDYKVVRLVNVRSNIKNFPRRVKVELYSLNAGCWKSIDVIPGSFCMPFHNHGQALVNGIVHWLAFREVNGKENNFIMCFDLSNELFGEIMLPQCLAGKCLEEISIAVFKESLHFFEYDGAYCHVWMMKEYGVKESWVHEFSFDKRVRESTGRPIAWRKNGEMLMSSAHDLYSFNAQSQAIVNLGRFGYCFCDGSYKESLVLLKESNDKRYDHATSKKRKERLPDLMQVMKSKAHCSGDLVVAGNGENQAASKLKGMSYGTCSDEIKGLQGKVRSMEEKHATELKSIEKKIKMIKEKHEIEVRLIEEKHILQVQLIEEKHEVQMQTIIQKQAQMLKAVKEQCAAEMKKALHHTKKSEHVHLWKLMRWVRCSILLLGNRTNCGSSNRSRSYQQI